MYRNFQNESFQSEISKIKKNIHTEVLVMDGIEMLNKNIPVLSFAIK